LKTLHCWPALPIIVQYGGSSYLDLPSPEDDDNIITALMQSSRVSSINLTVTRSLLEKLSAISEPFLELEELALLTEGNIQLTLPSTFRWGPGLRTLHSTRITFPSFPHLLSPCHELVDLQLHEIPSAGYFSPEAIANVLSSMTQLQSLTLHLLFFTRRRSHLTLPPPPGERFLLPALTRLKYRGTSKYLDSFVARVDAPHLKDIDITLFSQPTMDASQLSRFIERMDIQTSPSQADINTSEHAISMSFSDFSASTCLRLQIPCEQLDWQLSCMAQVCNQISAFLCRANDLAINTTQPSSGRDDVDGDLWLELVRSFGGTRNLLVAGELATDILCALRPAEGEHRTDTTVLPILRNLHVQKPLPMAGEFWDASQSFIMQGLSGRPIRLKLPCSLCDTSFTQPQSLKSHLMSRHTCRTVCSYCDFECEPRQERLFRKHLESKHFEVARNDSLISERIGHGYAFEHHRLVNRHTSLYAPDIVKESSQPHSPIASEPSKIAIDTSDDDPVDLTYFT
jgi:hypothetical protein